MGCCCGPVGRGVTSYTRGPGFEARPQQFFENEPSITDNCIENSKIKKKETENGPVKNIQKIGWTTIAVYYQPEYNKVAVFLTWMQFN